MGRRKSKFKFRPKKGKEISAAISSSSTPPPPWIELPVDITANILKRLGAKEILESAQKVCTTWRRVCHDPSMWRVIHLDNPEHFMEEYDLMCRQAVDRSQGQLVDLTLTYFGDDDLINYVADRKLDYLTPMSLSLVSPGLQYPCEVDQRLNEAFTECYEDFNFPATAAGDDLPKSSDLKRLTLQDCIDISGVGLVEAVKKLPHLEELHLIIMPTVEADDIKSIGISCPMLKSFSFNDRGSKKPNPEHYLLEDDEFTEDTNGFALAIAQSMPNLRHLRLFADWMKNEGLEAILDGCPHLESLDLRQCFRLELKQGALRKRCSEQIKHVKYPFDSISDIKWVADDSYPSDCDAEQLYLSQFSDYDSLDDYGFYDDIAYYDDYTNPFNNVSFFDDDFPWILDHDYF